MKTKREVIKTVGVILGMLVLFAGGVLLPYGLRDASLQRRVDTSREQLGIDGAENTGLVRLYGDVQNLREKIDGRGQYIPDEDKISMVLQDFSGLINTPGVTGQEIVTVKPNYYADYNILPVKIQFSAPFDTAFDLVGRIEKLSRVVRIDRCIIEADAEYPHQPLTVNLDLSAFFTSQAVGGAS